MIKFGKIFGFGKKGVKRVTSGRVISGIGLLSLAGVLGYMKFGGNKNKTFKNLKKSAGKLIPSF